MSAGRKFFSRKRAQPRYCTDESCTNQALVGKKKCKEHVRKKVSK